jgi:hypothetical protein
MLLCPCGTTLRPLLRAKIWWPKTRLVGRPSTAGNLARLILVLHAGLKFFDVEEFQGVSEVDIREEFIDLRLPFGLLELRPLHILTQVVQVLHPLAGEQLHVCRKQLARAERFEQRIREQGAERLLTEGTAGESHGGIPEWKAGTMTSSYVRRPANRKQISPVEYEDYGAISMVWPESNRKLADTISSLPSSLVMCLTFIVPLPLSPLTR